MPRFIAFLILLYAAFPAYSNSISQLQQALDSRHYDQAATLGLTLLRQQPQNVQAKFLTALAFQLNGQQKIAARQYQELIKLAPKLPEPRNNLAMIYMNEGKYDQAIDLLVATLNTHPAYATAWKNLKKLYQGLASEAYRKALSKEKNPRSVMDKIHLSALTKLYSTPTAKTPATLVASAERPRPIQHKPVPKLAIAPTPPTKPQQVTPQPAQSTKPIPPVTPVKATPPKPQATPVDAIRQWAQAWSNKNFARYLEAYRDNYKDRKPSHQAWVAYRRSRILKPGFIHVVVDRFKTKSASATRAIIDFRQQFSSPNYKDRVIKRLYLSKINGQWKITREKTLSVL